MSNEVNKLIQVSKLYYEDNLNQSQIAKELGVSRPLISTMLSKAREMGIVEIKIKEPFANNTLLLNQLKNLYNIQSGFVVQSSNSDYIAEKSVINQSVEYIKEILPEVKTMGLGWGHLMGELVEGLTKNEAVQLSEGNIVPLIGTASFPDKGYHPSELVREFAENTGMNPNFFFSPAFPTSEQERELYLNTDNYKEVEELWNSLDTVIVGIGGYPSVPDHATAMRFGTELHEKKAVGKILSYFYDIDGQIIHNDEDFVIQVPQNILGTVKRVIGICPEKVNPKAVLGALKTGFITHIVITEDKVRSVLSLRSQ